MFGWGRDFGQDGCVPKLNKVVSSVYMDSNICGIQSVVKEFKYRKTAEETQESRKNSEKIASKGLKISREKSEFRK